MTRPVFRRENTLVSWGADLLRVGLLAAILGVIHWQYVRALAQSQARGLAEVPLARVQAVFPARGDWEKRSRTAG